MNLLQTCAKCGGKMTVRDSRERLGFVWRRRECKNCLALIYTAERVCTEDEEKKLSSNRGERKHEPE